MNKACPFCSNTLPEEFAIRLETDTIFTNQQKRVETNYYSFACSCGAQGPHGYTKEEAVENWNRRIK